MCSRADFTHERIPRGRKENVYCVVSNAANVTRTAQGQHSIFDDDCGVWDTATGRTNRYPYLRQESGSFKRIFMHNKLYCTERVVEGRRTYVPYDPQPDANSVVHLVRYYTTQKDNTGYRKRVTWTVNNVTCTPHAVVEYSGTPVLSVPHGNSKASTGNPYLRTPVETLERIRSDVAAGVSCKSVYDTVVQATSEADAPRDPRVVRNAKYQTDLSKRREAKCHAATFADEVQQVCSKVVTDDFIQSVTLTHQRVPCIVMYNARQMDELKSFCFSKTAGSVWSFDKTYNLGHLYVTVSVYRNLALSRTVSDTVPTFLGPLFIHGNSDFETYAVFMGHLSARLSSCCFSELRMGSDEEASLRKAMTHCFGAASLVACTRHIKQNLLRNAHKVAIAACYFCK